MAAEAEAAREARAKVFTYTLQQVVAIVRRASFYSAILPLTWFNSQVTYTIFLHILRQYYVPK